MEIGVAIIAAVILALFIWGLFYLWTFIAGHVGLCLFVVLMGILIGALKWKGHEIQ